MATDTRGGTETRTGRSLQVVGKKVGFYGSVGIIVLISFFPIIWMFITSLKPPAEAVQFPVTYIPAHVTLQNYRTVFAQAPFVRYLFNSFVVASGTVVIDVFLGSLAGYALSRLDFEYKLPVLLVILLSSTLPFVSRLLPLFKLARQVHLLNDYLGLIIPYAAFQLPFAVWIMQAYFNDLPDSLEDAAIMDGLTRIGVLFRIIVPVSAPAMVTSAIIVFIYSWNEFLFALTFMTQDKMRTITVGIALYQGQYSFPWGTISAAVILSIIPLFAFMVFFQQRIVEGLTAGTGGTG